MIPDQTISIKINKQNRKKYIKLGYSEAETSEYIELNIKDLSKYSDNYVEVICDYCGEKYQVKYSAINTSRKHSLIKKDCCNKCRSLKLQETLKLKYGVNNAGQIVSGQLKRKQTNLKKYGVECALQNDNIKQKQKLTCLKRYGVENPLQNNDIKKKWEQTCLIRYGVKNISQDADIQAKKEYISLQKYGVRNPLQNDNIKEKIKQTNLKRYGVEYPIQCEKIRNKVANSYFLSGKIRTSSQQIYLFNMIKKLGYNAILNYPESFLNLDVAVFIDNKKIDIEYDGWYWHQNISKDIARNHVLFKYGWNIIRILSNRLLPEKEQIQEAINNVLVKNKQIQLIQLDDWKNNEMKDEVI